MSSAYNIATNDIGSTVEAAKWNKIWKLKTPNRIKTFIWLVRHGKILTNNCRRSRGLTDDDRCWNCPNEVEDIDHVLRKCPRAMEIWATVLSNHYVAYLSRPLLEWLDHGISFKKTGITPGSDSSLFAIVLWWIWKWRNEAIFNNKTVPLQTKVSWIMTQWAEISTAFSRAENQQHRDGSNNWKKLCWVKPHGEYMKMNIDGSVDPPTKRAGCGGVLRDCKGEWKGGFVCSIGVCSPTQAEAWALLRGIQVAKQLGCKKVIFESDSQKIVDSINRDNTQNPILHNILTACKREMGGFESWQVIWAAREQNGPADKLAALSGSYDRGVHILMEPPEILKRLLQDDAMGIPCWRNVNCNR